MNKYALIEGDKVTNIIVSNEPPTDVTSIEISGSLSIGVSRDWKYDSTSNTFIKPLKAGGDRPFAEIDGQIASISFNKSIPEYSSSKITYDSDQITISNYTWIDSDNRAEFIITLAPSSSLNVGENIILNLAPHTDSDGYTWNLGGISFELVESGSL
jgi:hypothetical protein